MSGGGYRDELGAAQARIADLEAQLEEARAEIQIAHDHTDAAADLAALEMQDRGAGATLAASLLGLRRATVGFAAAMLLMQALAFWLWYDTSTRFASIPSAHEFPWGLEAFALMFVGAGVVTETLRVATRGRFAREKKERRLRIGALKLRLAAPARLRVARPEAEPSLEAEREAEADAELGGEGRARR